MLQILPHLLIDNLGANLGNRNQLLNQQGNCIRTNGCTTSDVVQGPLGIHNSVTGFADQRNNILHAPTDTTTTTAHGVILAVNNVLWFGFQADRYRHS
jgi:hypothetical protein